jgi:hypothetical protein
MKKKGLTPKIEENDILEMSEKEWIEYREDMWNKKQYITFLKKNL